MSDDTQPHTEPTRRDYLQYGGALIGSGLLAGCTGDSSSDPTSTSEPPTTGSDESYTAELAPAGEVTFESVPEDVFTILSHHTGMALALGRGDDINAMHAPGYVESLYEKFLARLDGVSVDWEGLYSSWPPTKEKLYELDSDVHLADPAKVASADGWSDDDIAEIADNVAPWFGNTYSESNANPPAEWQDDYEYYTLWEIFARVADVFKEQQRYQALAAVHRSMLDSFEQSLPPKSERPSAAMVLFSTQNDTIWAYELNQVGYYAAHTRPLGATDALVDAFPGFASGETADYEMLAEADPDILLVLGGMTSYHDIDEIRTTLNEDPVASQISAVSEDRIYTQGSRRQGPLVNLFQLEMTAKQLYPDEFGEWPGYATGESYPEIPAEEQLFDRQRVADIITGEF